MSSDSEPDEFFDAEEASLDRITRQQSRNKLHDSEKKELEKLTQRSTNILTAQLELAKNGNDRNEDSLGNVMLIDNEMTIVETAAMHHSDNEEKSAFHNVSSDVQESKSRLKDIEKRRRRVQEARRRMQSEDIEDAYETLSSVPGSQTSSLDGVWAAIRSCNPPTVETKDESDSNTFSLGKVGRILGDRDDLMSQTTLDHLTKNISIEHHQVTVTITAPTNETETLDQIVPVGPKLAEPDVVASTKGACEVNFSFHQQPMPPPVAPPRKKRKNKAPLKPSSLPPLSSDSNSQLTACKGIPSPASTVESITKMFEHSLDLPSAVRGQYVVKPQDEEMTKAEGPSLEEREILAAVIANQLLAAGGESIDPGLTKQLNMLVRTRTDSGKQLSDLEILEQVMVLNLDTGEKIPLSLAEDRLPRCLNPLSLHIMRLTSEYVSNSSLERDKESDDDNVDAKSKASTLSVSSDSIPSTKKKSAQFKRLINRTVEKTVSKIKSVADEVYHARHSEDIMESSEEEPTGEQRHVFKFKASGSHKGPYEFNNLKLVQDLSGEHTGAVWTMKFSYCGRLLATVGQDHVLRIWVLKDSFEYFNDMRQKYNAEARISPTPSQESLTSHQSGEDTERQVNVGEQELLEDVPKIFADKPFCNYVGHTADLLDVSWSKNYFILSSSMDKTVRLWHISRKECLCCFQHIDFVTAIAFHPRDDRYFLSGSLDGKLRLWNIPDKKVALWNELDGQTKLITAASFCQNGKFAVVGTYDGRCIFYTTEQLKYYTQIHVRSTRGKNAKGRKISGIEPMPGEDKILVTSNDSRIRLYDLRDLSLSCKYKGYANLSSQIRASFSHDGKYIVSGSENQYVYLWKTHHDFAKFSSVRKDRNDFWEGIKAHNAVVTSAVFAPNPDAIFRQIELQKAVVASTAATPTESSASFGTTPTALPTAPCSDMDRYVLVTADFGGGIKVFVNKSKSAAKSVTP